MYMCKSVHPNRCLSLAKMEMRSTVSTALFVLLTVSLGILWMCDATIQVERPRGVSLSSKFVPLSVFLVEFFKDSPVHLFMCNFWGAVLS